MGGTPDAVGVLGAELCAGDPGVLFLLSKLFVFTKRGAEERRGDGVPFGESGLNFRRRNELSSEGKHVCTFW